MDDNHYRVPESRLGDSPDESEAFYVVAPYKFWMLAVLTMGLYVPYWFYRNWAAYRDSARANVWPVPRALFSVFFTHSLFAHIDSRVRQQSPAFAWSASNMAWAYVVAAIAANLLARAAGEEVSFMILSLVLTVGMCIPLSRAQDAINAAHGDPAGSSNKTLTAANWFWLVIGALLWSLTLLGIFYQFYPAPTE
ncbi:hypothetical protein [Tahibacter amnicola]|uniref:DUF4234 domain-containing protein n=1 Tax=Tahibacter amnicola TaxID=2976241 RepID=A0ABY6BJD5_9GAMM|nr:hypothetical protein [Tahibacter amnicola]UXI69960.1 hypothetical protein N4264_10135 [Tahibacter amnicola]